MGRIDTVRRREDTTRTEARRDPRYAGDAMPKKSAGSKPGRVVRLPLQREATNVVQDILWRLDRLERQVHTLSELVRDHAEDADRLVRIVAEDREVLRRELLRQHQARLRLRRHVRGDDDRAELTSS